MGGFEESSWADTAFTGRFLESADLQIVERRRMFTIARSFYTHFFGTSGGTRVLDLGCGDGILTSELIKAGGVGAASLVDASAEMLARAKERLSGFRNITFIQSTFQDLITGSGDHPRFDLVVSSLAIHHIPLADKRLLFRKIYSMLDPEGFFLVIDGVLPPTVTLEDWYIELWREWIAEKGRELGRELNFDEFIFGHHQEKHHHDALDTLDDQLNAMRDIGFSEVDCIYKYGIFSMFCGKKEAS
ncbi:MAG: class I SAM-dependent methyltransferase [Methanoregulaceae archaeon]|nr:class I SAM-dependent methyltransferase [Methanoregulaceae archaeon]